MRSAGQGSLQLVTSVPVKPCARVKVRSGVFSCAPLAGQESFTVDGRSGVVARTDTTICCAAKKVIVPAGCAALRNDRLRVVKPPQGHERYQSAPMSRLASSP